jgi:uncharacterized protein (DUF58 family)
MNGAGALTMRGWAVSTAAVVLGAAAYLFGVEELWPIAVAAALLVVAAWIWVHTCRWDVRVVRHIRPARVPAGLSARVELTVSNHAGRRSPVLSARDPFDGGTRWARFLIAPLEPGEVRLAAYSLPTTRRGVFQLGPLELDVADPFGLARSTRLGSPTSALTVHPHVEAIRSRPVASDPDPDTRVPLPLVGRIGDEFYALREYRSGDDLRRVHWAATARQDALMIRQPENLLQGRLTVAVDLRAEMHDPANLEAALSAAASLVVAAVRSRVHVRLLTTAGTRTPFGSTAMHSWTIMDLLAAAELHPGSNLADDFRLGPEPGPVTLFTTSSASPGELGLVARLGERGGTTIVVFERDGAGPLTPGFTLRPMRCRFVTVAAGASFQAAWEGAQC